jgi:hypothetical protein
MKQGEKTSELPGILRERIYREYRACSAHGQKLAGARATARLRQRPGFALIINKKPVRTTNQPATNPGGCS